MAGRQDLGPAERSNAEEIVNNLPSLIGPRFARFTLACRSEHLGWFYTHWIRNFNRRTVYDDYLRLKLGVSQEAVDYRLSWLKLYHTTTNSFLKLFLFWFGLLASESDSLLFSTIENVYKQVIKRIQENPNEAISAHVSYKMKVDRALYLFRVLLDYGWIPEARKDDIATIIGQLTVVSHKLGLIATQERRREDYVRFRDVNHNSFRQKHYWYSGYGVPLWMVPSTCEGENCKLWVKRPPLYVHDKNELEYYTPTPENENKAAAGPIKVEMVTLEGFKFSKRYPSSDDPSVPRLEISNSNMTAELIETVERLADLYLDWDAYLTQPTRRGGGVGFHKSAPISIGEVLQISPTNLRKYSYDSLKSACRQLMMLVAPDKHHGEIAPEHTESFNRAYEVANKAYLAIRVLNPSTDDMDELAAGIKELTKDMCETCAYYYSEYVREHKPDIAREAAASASP